MKKKGSGSVSPRSPKDVDKLVGENVRRLRVQRNLTLTQLASQIGISHQQLQKYETGSNRLSAGTLFAVAAALGVTIERVFQSDAAAAPQALTRKKAALDDLRTEGVYWLTRTNSEVTLRHMVQVLKALSAEK